MSTKASRLKELLIAAMVVLTPAFGVNASAAPILDQQYVPTGGGSLIIRPEQDLTQVFTVGLAGLLSSVQVQVARDSNPVPTDPITLSIIDASGGIPNFSSVLASAQISPAQVSGAYTFVSVDLSAQALLVSVGQQLAIHLTTTEPAAPGGGIAPYAWFGDLVGVYASGDSFVRTSRSLRDYGFRTFVDATQVVPEPASLTLFATGLLIAARRWRRR